MDEPSHQAQTHDIVVVGPCAAGKSTLVQALRERGYHAREVQQEHSGVPYLWQHFQPLDVLIYLDARLATIAERRTIDFSDDYLDELRYRLRHARQNCDLYLQTDGLTAQEVLEKVVAFLDSKRDA